MKKLLLASLAFAAAVAPALAPAAIVVTAPTSNTSGTFQITNPITFNITASGNANFFGLTNWVTSDGNQQGSSLTPDLRYTLNGTNFTETSGLYDNIAGTGQGTLTANDGLLRLLNNGPAVKAGDVLTLLPGTYTIGNIANFNPQCTQTFTGTMYATAGGFTRLSGPVSAGPAAAPEPSTWALLGVGALGAGVMALRRRTQAA